MIRTWTLGLLCVLVTAFFVGYTINSQKVDTLADARSHLVNNVHYLNMDIERTFYGLNQTFKGIQNYLSVFTRQNKKPTTEEIQPILDDLVKDHPYVTTFLVLNAEGTTDYSSGFATEGDLRYTDYYSVHKSHNLDHLYVGRPVVAKHNNSWTFAVSKGLRDNKDQLASVMVAILDLEYIKKSYSGLPLEQGASMTVSSADDYVYLHLPENTNLAGRYIKGITTKTDLAGKTLVTRQTMNNKQVDLVAQRQARKYPLFVSIRIPEASILANWKKSAKVFLCLGIIISLTLLLMTQRVAKYQKKQQQIKEILHDQATTDSLTNLANRRFVLEQAAHEIKKARRSGTPLSFVLMDLDHFKTVNDNYGHETGDMVLRDTAVILQKLCRESDIVSRYGGEEFLLVLPDTDLDGALSDAERIRRALERTSHWSKNNQFSVTASFGVSQWQENEVGCDEVLRRADDALYRVKSKGRNSIMSLQMDKVTPLRKKYQHTGNEADGFR